MPFQQASDSTVIVEDEYSPYYNQIKDLSELPKGTDVDPIGKRLTDGTNNASIFIEHNGNGYSQSGVVSGAGSSITICGMYSDIAPTGGCIDISSSDMLTLLGYLNNSEYPHIITE